MFLYGLSTVRSVRKKQRRANIPQYGWSKRGKWVVYYMALGLNLFIFNLLAFVIKNTQLMTSVEKNIDLATTNQNIPIYLKTTKPCDKNWYYPLIKCCWSLKNIVCIFPFAQLCSSSVTAISLLKVLVLLAYYNVVFVLTYFVLIKKQTLTWLFLLQWEDLT